MEKKDNNHNKKTACREKLKTQESWQIMLLSSRSRDSTKQKQNEVIW